MNTMNLVARHLAVLVVLYMARRRNRLSEDNASDHRRISRASATSASVGDYGRQTP